MTSTAREDSLEANPVTLDDKEEMVDEEEDEHLKVLITYIV